MGATGTLGTIWRLVVAAERGAVGCGLGAGGVGLGGSGVAVGAGRVVGLGVGGGGVGDGGGAASATAGRGRGKLMVGGGTGVGKMPTGASAGRPEPPPPALDSGGAITTAWSIRARESSQACRAAKPSATSRQAINTGRARSHREGGWGGGGVGSATWGGGGRRIEGMP